jgi:uncharacterized membrane protein YphA (DoxX/SURF4 family)
MNRALWVVQVLLAIFMGLASGLPKLIVPIDNLPMPIPIPAALLMSIGVLEILGALGLLLPPLTSTAVWLTPLAALGIGLVALGGMGYQLMARESGNAAFALVVALLAMLVGYGRWRVAPHRRPIPRGGQ